MLILGIETTCDETASAVIRAQNGSISVLSNIVSSQAKLHSRWGGVVPNLAAREHLKNIIPVIKESFQKARIRPEDVDLITVANGPGLIPALLIGVNAAKTLSYVLKKPLLGVHHIERHIYANFIPSGRNKIGANLKFPILCLVVSGGHTQLVLMRKHLDYRIIGQTQDDAAGEAFDKVAKILGLGYPGGPAVAACAADFQFPISPPKADQPRADNFQKKFKNKNPKKILAARYEILNTIFPRPMINSRDFNFSFSGLKTAVLYETKKNPRVVRNKRYISEICQEFQQAVCDVLISKTIDAAQKYNPKTILLAGGVAANQELRKQLGKAIKLNLPNTRYQIPDIKYCIDNAVMIATAGYWRWQNAKNKKISGDNWKKLTADANLKL